MLGVGGFPQRVSGLLPDLSLTPGTHRRLGTRGIHERTGTYTETPNTLPGSPHHRPQRSPAARRLRCAVNTHSSPPARGTRSLPHPAPGCVRSPLGAAVSVCPRLPGVPPGGGGEAARSERRAGRPRRREGERGRGSRPGEEERSEEAAPAERGGGAESSDWEPRARLGSGRGGAAGTAALPAWAEP